MSATVSEAKRGWRIAKTFLTAFFEHSQPELAKRMRMESANRTFLTGELRKRF